MNNSDKTAQICALYFIPVRNSEIENYPGMNYIHVRGEWTFIPISSGEFKEITSPGETIEQELKAVVTNTGMESLTKLTKLFLQNGLIRMKLTNGDDKVIGTDQFPIRITLENSGSPAKLTLSCKRNSPEASKLFKSF